MKHLLSLEAISGTDMRLILDRVAGFKRDRATHARPLTGQTWALIFSKSSTRTRVSFEVGLRELGAQVLFLNAGDIQLGRGEPITGKTVTFVGDAACNVPVSWIWAAARLGFTLRLAAPRAYWPAEAIVKRAAAGGAMPWSGYHEAQVVERLEIGSGMLELLTDLNLAARQADLLYTDVWVSMGKEAESAQRLTDLAGYQINADLVKLAKRGALVMHCLPAYRGKEIDEATFEAHADTIFTQAENRLHTQKAIVDWMVG